MDNYELEYFDNEKLVGKDKRESFTAMTNLVSIMFRHHDKILVYRIREGQRKEILKVEWTC
jgi:hypothetical protein